MEVEVEVEVISVNREELSYKKCSKLVVLKNLKKSLYRQNIVIELDRAVSLTNRK